MPTYEYVCDACGHQFDEFQSFSDKPLKKCPACKKSKLRRLFGTGAALIFKGSGFYQTDYRSESYKAGAKADSASTSSSESKSETKSETKSEAKSDSSSSSSGSSSGSSKSSGKAKS